MGQEINIKYRSIVCTYISYPKGEAHGLDKAFNNNKYITEEGFQHEGHGMNACVNNNNRFWSIPTTNRGPKITTPYEQ